MHNKTQTLARIKGDKWDASELSDMKVAVYGGAAVVTGVWAGKGTSEGKSVNSHERWTDTWITRHGKWQCVASHASQIKK